MSTEGAMLRSAVMSLRNDFERLGAIFTNQEIGLFDVHADNVLNRFSRLKTDSDKVFDAIDAAIGDQQWTLGWERYAHARTKLLPNLANELLAVIAGLYLKEKFVDNARPGRDDGPGGSVLSFTMLAEDLVKDLVRRTSSDWRSVLVVGNERYAYTPAGVIRLSFAACTVWNLPFAARNFGFMLAHESPPPAWKALQEKVVQEVNPAHHLLGSPPQAAEAFLPEIQAIWRHYHQTLSTADERASYLEEQAALLVHLEEVQYVVLNHLFADAFAVLFVGPAYLHSLMHLNFVPDAGLYQPRDGWPSFASRYMVAFETLRWLNGDPFSLNTGQRYGTLFLRELHEQAGTFPQLWRASLSTLKRPDHYQRIRTEMGPWLDTLLQSFREYPRNMAVEETYRHWQLAQSLEEQMAQEPRVTPEQKARVMLAAVNAAWSARAALGANEQSDVGIIENNALRLIDPDNGDVLIDESPVQDVRRNNIGQSGGRAQISPEREADITLVKKALTSSDQIATLWQDFAREASTGQFTYNKHIAFAIGDLDEAFEAYLRLTGVGG